MSVHTEGGSERVRWSATDLADAPAWVRETLRAATEAAGHLAEHGDVDRVELNAGAHGVALWVYFRYRATGHGLNLKRLATDLAERAERQYGIRVNYGSAMVLVDEDTWLPLSPGRTVAWSIIYWSTYATRRGGAPPPADRAAP